MVHTLLDFGLPPKTSLPVHPTYVRTWDVVLYEISQETKPTYSTLILMPKFWHSSVPIKRYGSDLRVDQQGDKKIKAAGETRLPLNGVIIEVLRLESGFYGVRTY